MGKFLTLAGTAAGGVGLVFAFPTLLGFIGFTASGIAAGSFAANMMSAAAAANGGGVAAGSLVALLQSAGAAGLSAKATAAVAMIGGSIGAACVGWLKSFFQEKRREENDSIVGWLRSFFQKKKEEKRREENIALGIVAATLVMSAIYLHGREVRGRRRN